MYPIYPTQKNLQMLEFIIEASSTEDSIVMDCFCGSGTTLVAAGNCGRRWIGIDKSSVAVQTSETNIKGNSSSLFSSSYEKISLQ